MQVWAIDPSESCFVGLGNLVSTQLKKGVEAAEEEKEKFKQSFVKLLKVAKDLNSQEVN